MRAPSPIRAPLGMAGILALALTAACSEYASDAGPEHCGNIGTETWGRDLNPHDVTCDVTVSGDLTIGPGTRIRFAPGTSLIVQGSLSVEGTADRPVRMEQAEEGRGWVGIWVRAYEDDVTAQRPNPDELPASANPGAVSLQNVVISGAGISPEGGATFRPAAVILDRGPVDFIDVTIEDARQCGLSMGADGRIGVDTTGLTITGSLEAPICSHAQALSSLPAEGLTLDEGVQIDVYGATLTGSHTWRNLGVPYRITESLQLPRGELIVEAGNTFSLFANNRLTFGGGTGAQTYGAQIVASGRGPLPRDEAARIDFQGTASAPITFDVEPNLGEGSRWDRIHLVGTNSTSVTARASLSHVVLRNGGAGVDNEPASLQVSGDVELTLTDVTVEGSGGAGLLLDDGAVLGADSTNLTLTGNAYPVVTHPDGALTLPAEGSDYTGNSGQPASGVRDGGDFIYLTEEGISTSGTLQELGVPYRLDGDLDVQGGPDESLAIEPGVQVQVPGAGEVRLGSNSALNLTLGTADGAPVQFVAADEVAPWDSLTLGAALSDTSTVDNLEVMGAGRAGSSAAVEIRATELLVNGLTIDGTEEGVPGLRVPGSFAEGSSGLVVRNAQGTAVIANTDAVASLPKPGVELTNNGAFSVVQIDGLRVGVGGTWSNLDVPYRITSLLNISGRELADGTPENARVVVEPGVTFQVEPRSGLRINSLETATGARALGALALEGTADQPITFQPTDAEEGWSSIYFNYEFVDEDRLDDVPPSVLSHVVIDGAGASFAQASLEFWDASPAANDITIRDGFLRGVATWRNAYVEPITRIPDAADPACDVFDLSVYTFEGELGRALEPDATDLEHLDGRVFIDTCE